MVFTQLLRRLGFPFTMHGFRSSFCMWAAEKTDYATRICEAALAHVIEDKTERAYNRSPLLEKRVPLMNDWAAYIAKSVKAQ